MRLAFSGILTAVLTFTAGGVVCADDPATESRERVSLGVRVAEATQGRGVEVLSVKPGSAADRAGVRGGDRIVALGRHPIRSVDDLGEALGRLRPGQRTRVSIVRGRRTIRLNLDFSAAPQASAAPVRLGARLREGGGRGVEVVELAPDSVLRGHVSPGDRLLELGGVAIDDLATLKRVLGELDASKPVALRVSSRGRASSWWLDASSGSLKPAGSEGAAGERVVLGVQLQARAKGPGLEVLQVRAGSAAHGRLQVGDVILRWSGHDIRDMDDMERALARLQGGGKTRMRVLRQGQQLAVHLPALGGPVASTPREKPAPAREKVRFGVQVQDAAEGGVEVLQVAPGTTAAAAGLRVGDRILSFRGDPIASVEELGQAFGDLRRGQRGSLTVQRGEARKRLWFRWGSTEPEAAPKSTGGRATLGVTLSDDGRIEAVRVGSAAHVAGLQSGDRILSVAGIATPSVKALQKAIASHAGGAEVVLLVERDGRRLELTATLDTRGGKKKAKTAKESKPKKGKPGKKGKKGKDAPAATGEKPWLGAALEDTGEGVVISELAPQGPTLRAGLRKGDVIVALAGEQVRTVDEFAAIFSRLRAGQKIVIEIRRDGWSKKIPMTLEARR